MQAGESLSFISVPDELAIPEAFPKEEQEASLYEFYLLAKHLLSRAGDAVSSCERPEEIGTVIAKEASFHVPFNDGSYLHLVVYGHEFEGDYLDLGLSVAEHSDDGKYLGGYLYELIGCDLRYTRQFIPTEDEDDEDDPLYHFSLLEQYAHKDELFATALTGNDEQREYAEEQLAEWDQAVQRELIEKDMGMTWRQPAHDDILKLHTLVQLASPFKVPQQ